MARATRTMRMKNVSQVGAMEFLVAAAFRTESGSRRANHAISLAYAKRGGTELLSATSVEAAPERRGVFSNSHHISGGASSCAHMSLSDAHATSLIFSLIFTLQQHPHELLEWFLLGREKDKVHHNGIPSHAFIIVMR
ncbi:hypothetical protein TRVL_05096 [Trypanosoma vivax]|nr:hypothetical protein TRVL_05096 [Trypanosoma vivax]